MSRRMSGRTVRIIGGNWRGRKVSFATREGIRPTPARVRETLFNWLQHGIHGARCLELYAGSGILGIEALSRGAAHVTLVDRNRQVMDKIRETLEALCPDPGRYACLVMSAERWLRSADETAGTYDVVFLDPPFGTGELSRILPVLKASPVLARGALVYIESDHAVAAGALPLNWTIRRQKRAGQVHYCLVRTD